MATKMATGGAASKWAAQDQRRMAHAVIRVAEIDKTIEYYQKHFGMKLLRSMDDPEKKFRQAFMGFGPEEKHFALELTYNYGVEKYNLGDFGHFAIALPDVHKACESIKAAGGKVVRDAGPVKGGDTVIAFVEDPTGYKFELIQRPESPEPLCQVMLRVSDLEKALDFYTKCLGLKLLRKQDNPEYKYTLAFLGYGPEDSSIVFELTYNWEKEGSYEMGDGFTQVAIVTNDVHKTAHDITEAGFKVVKEPSEVQGVKVTAATDPDGWKIAFLDNADFEKQLKS